MLLDKSSFKVKLAAANYKITVQELTGNLEVRADGGRPADPK